MAIYTPQGTLVQPGDFAVVRTRGDVGKLIEIGEWMAVRAYRFGQNIPKLDEDWMHAIFYAGGSEDLILEAEPGGAKYVPFHYQHEDVLWSSDTPALSLTTEQRSLAGQIAWKYWRTPYSFLDYEAIALHSLHIWAPNLDDYVKSTKHMICSQLVDRCRMDMGSQLFVDKRWEGFVMPLDLRFLITNPPAKLAA